VHRIYANACECARFIYSACIWNSDSSLTVCVFDISELCLCAGSSSLLEIRELLKAEAHVFSTVQYTPSSKMSCYDETTPDKNNNMPEIKFYSSPEDSANPAVHYS
jgi:hypothetical protein